MAGIVYLDFDLQIQRAGEGYRAQVLNSPAGQAAVTFSMPLSELEIENFLLRVGRARSGSRRIDSPEVKAAKACGERLFSAVFEGEVRGCLRSSLDEANRQGAGLRIRLRLTDVPELADLPWEYLYNPTLNRFLALSVETPFVRYLDLPEAIRPLAVKPPLRALVMISSPSDYPRLDVEREWAKLCDALGDLEQRGLLALERLDDATLVSLQRRLRREQYHIFHFIGHGGFDEHAQDGVLILEDERERGRPVSGQDLGMLLHDHRPMRLAILNACEGARASRSDPFAGTAQSLVQQGIPAVIAMQFQITDEAAITFAHEFYGAVADDYPVDAALAEARKAIFAQGNGLEWGTPVLYMRCPDGHIFQRQGSPKEVGEGVVKSEETVEERRIAEPRVAHHPSVGTEGRFKALAGKWKQVGAGILLMMLLIGGALWFKGEWLTKDTPQAPVPQMVSLTVHTDKRELKIKEIVTLKVKGRYSDGREREVMEGVEWRSSNPSVATASPGGRVQGQKAGNADITVRYAGVVSPPLTLFVKGEEPPKELSSPGVRLVSLSVHADKRALKVKERVALRVKGIYSDGKEGEIPRGVKWRSSNGTIAAVDRRGRVVGRKEGSVDITAQYAGVVSPPLTLFIKGAPKRPELKASRTRRVKNHINVAKSYRERGEYSDALTELRKARSIDPTNKEVQAEIEVTRRACNAEKRLGRSGLKC
ncbi:MAG: CHAT domain-containing protein [Deltaproteobacteria bacterium]|nr:CHAT domain-containing protein [Deltaproteobacteria bacterium]